MKSGINKIIQGLLLVPLLTLGVSFVSPVVASAAVDCSGSTSSIECGASSAQGTGQPESLFGGEGEQGLFQTVVNIMLFIVGAVAVIMLILGGLRYVTSNGDQNNVTAAKNTILYAIIGIIVAILSFAVVNFVVTGLTPN